MKGIGTYRSRCTHTLVNAPATQHLDHKHGVHTIAATTMAAAAQHVCCCFVQRCSVVYVARKSSNVLGTSSFPNNGGLAAQSLLALYTPVVDYANAICCAINCIATAIGTLQNRPCARPWVCIQLLLPATDTPEDTATATTTIPHAHAPLLQSYSTQIIGYSQLQCKLHP